MYLGVYCLNFHPAGFCRLPLLFTSFSLTNLVVDLISNLNLQTRAMKDDKYAIIIQNDFKYVDKVKDV